MKIRSGKRHFNRNKPDAMMYIIHGSVKSSYDWRVLRDYVYKYHFQSEIAGVTTTKRVKFFKTAVNGK